MYRLLNGSGREFIVFKKEVLKGGNKHPNPEHTTIGRGRTVEVVDRLGKQLETYPEITVLDIEAEKKGK